jgi:hypothetical protein
VRASETDAGILFSRGRGDLNCLTAAITNLFWESVDFGPLAQSQRVAPALPNGLSGTVAIKPVDPARTVVLTGHNLGLNGLGETDPTTTSEGPASALGVHLLVGDGGTASSLSTTRTSGQGDALWDVWLLTFEP